MSSCMDIDSFNGKKVTSNLLPDRDDSYTVFDEVLLKWKYIRYDNQTTIPYTLRSSVKTA